MSPRFAAYWTMENDNPEGAGNATRGRDWRPVFTRDLMAVYLSGLRRRMARYRCSLMFLNAACLVLLGVVANPRPLLVIGLFKLLAFLTLACLLAFVIVHSLDICRLLIACLQALQLGFFPLSVESSMGRAITDTHHGLNQPSLRLLFQRPPPLRAL